MVGFSPNVPLTVGIKTGSTGLATAVSGGMAGPSVAGELVVVAVSLLAVSDPCAPEDWLFAADGAHAARAISGTAAIKARQRMQFFLLLPPPSATTETALRCPWDTHRPHDAATLKPTQRICGRPEPGVSHR